MTVFIAIQHLLRKSTAVISERMTFMPYNPEALLQVMNYVIKKKRILYRSATLAKNKCLLAKHGAFILTDREHERHVVSPTKCPALSLQTWV